MGKNLALYAYIEIDGVQFIDGKVRSYDLQSEDSQEDVSGFNASGNDEMMAGARARSIALEFFTDRAAGEMAQVIYPLHRDRVTFTVVFRADQNAPASAANPEWRGDCILPQWNETAQRGTVETTTLTFVSNGDNGLERYYS
jgi:hypothetical protein